MPSVWNVMFGSASAGHSRSVSSAPMISSSPIGCAAGAPSSASRPLVPGRGWRPDQVLLALVEVLGVDAVANVDEVLGPDLRGEAAEVAGPQLIDAKRTVR